MKSINRVNESSLSHKYVTTVLDYDSNTGIFKWKVKMSTRALPGGTAGTLRPTGYIAIKLDGRAFLAHRLAWFYVYEVWPDNTIDHIDRNPANNSISNLRDVTNSINMLNRGLFKKNISGITGVIYDDRCSMWKATITINGEVFRLGSFLDLNSAIEARRKAEEEHKPYITRLPPSQEN